MLGSQAEPPPDPFSQVSAQKKESLVAAESAVVVAVLDHTPEPLESFRGEPGSAPVQTREE